MFQPFTYEQWTLSLLRSASTTKPFPNSLRDTNLKQRSRGRPEEEKFDPYRHITEQQHRIALEAAFGLKEEYGYKELEDALIKTYMSVGVKLNHKKAVSLITMLRKQADDSAGERQEIHLHAQLPLLALYIQLAHFPAITSLYSRGVYIRNIVK